MPSIQELENEVNSSIPTGKAMEAFEKFYADDVVMQENSDEPFVGKDVNRKRELEFFGSVEEFHGAKVVSSAVNEEAGVGFSEWVYDVTFKSGGRVKMEQTAVRYWKDGKVVKERFYHPGH